MNWYLFVLKIGYFIAIVNGAIIPDDNIKEQGLYRSADHVTILTKSNFERKVYGQAHPFLVQFYNSYCGHCRAFSPKFKSLANSIKLWKNIIELAVIDCSIEENNEICREFEVMAYPSLRYLHENYVKANGNVGDRFPNADTAENLKGSLLKKMQNEQTLGRLKISPPLNIAPYSTIEDAMHGLSTDTLYVFLVFESENSTVGPELALDICDYEHVQVKRVYNDSELANVVGLKKFPGIVALSPDSKYTKLGEVDANPTKMSLLKSLNVFLKSNNYKFPVRNIDFDDPTNHQLFNEHAHLQSDPDTVYYSDLEKTLKTSLHTEITRFKILSGEPLNALKAYIDVLIVSFPFKNVNLKAYLTDLRNSLNTRSQWNGSDIYDLVKTLESVHEPVYSTDLQYIGCRGSQPKYRGYTCGLWTLFHTLTVNSLDKGANQGGMVLKSILGYVKYFFGCTECSEHFQAMAEKNRLLNVKENDKAILWLWIAHNEVNLRLAGDTTEDPEYPKIQFPSVIKCPECRLSRGAWNLPAIYQYLLKVYSGNSVSTSRKPRTTDPAMTPFSDVDIGMLSLLYILSFFLIILIVKFLLAQHFSRKRRFKQAWAKVQA